MDLDFEKMYQEIYDHIKKRDAKSTKPLSLENDLPELNANSLLRIADSLEKMERPFLEQITHIKNLEQANEDLREKIFEMKSQNQDLKNELKTASLKPEPKQKPYLRMKSNGVFTITIELAEILQLDKKCKLSSFLIPGQGFAITKFLNQEYIHGVSPQKKNSYPQYEFRAINLRNHLIYALGLDDAAPSIKFELSEGNEYTIILKPEKLDIPRINPGKGGSNV